MTFPVYSNIVLEESEQLRTAHFQSLFDVDRSKTGRRQVEYCQISGRIIYPP